ncbi:MAG: hypothetical protein KAI06_07085, partial [Anaerolineales bacterium]|nr:hypothetical protein [Anaerolineales bacterium]
QGTDGILHGLDVQCSGMKMPNSWKRAAGWILAALTLSLIPTILAYSAAPSGTVFTGFLLNPLDGFSYLAKMKQGADGAWLFTLPYAVEPGPGTFLFVYHLLLGNLSRWTGISTIVVFHAVRVIASGVMFLLIYVLFKAVLPETGPRRSALLLTIFGSGLGWLTVPLFSLQPSDLTIPESIPFLIAYGNAHFPLAAAALLGGILVILLLQDRPGLRLALALLCGTIIGAVLPFSALSLFAAGFAWYIWEATLNFRKFGSGALNKWALPNLAPILGLVAGATPWLLYDFWVSRIHPVISAWNTQNQTLSPPPLNYFLGYGLVLILAIVGIWRSKPAEKKEGRLLLSWLLTGVILLYIPVPFQRRLSLGLYFPMAALAGLGWHSLTSKLSRSHLLTAILILLVLPSNLLVVSSGLLGVTQGQPAVVHYVDETTAYQWAAENLPQGSLILAAPETGNRIPAFATLRVLYGHPFETPDADVQKQKVEELFNSGGGATSGMQQLLTEGVDYVFYGPREQEIGNPPWLSDLELIGEFGKVRLYEVITP